MSEQSSFRVLQERGGLRCPYCHGDVLEEEAQEECEVCRASHHQECWDAHGGCSSCGVARQLAGPTPAAGPQQLEQVRRRRRATRLGGVGLLRYEHGENHTTLEWGSNMGDARTRLTIQMVFLLGLIIGPALGLLGGVEVAIGLLILGFFASLYVGIPVAVYHLLELRKTGRIIITSQGYRRDRMGFKGQYLSGETIPWSDIAELGWRGSRANRSYTVYAETASGRRTLADFRFEQHAREFIGHFQRSRARLAAEVDASLIRVQRRDENTKGA